MAILFAKMQLQLIVYKRWKLKINLNYLSKFLLKYHVTGRNKWFSKVPQVYVVFFFSLRLVTKQRHILFLLKSRKNRLKSFQLNTIKV